MELRFAVYDLHLRLRPGRNNDLIRSQVGGQHKIESRCDLEALPVIHPFREDTHLDANIACLELCWCQGNSAGCHAIRARFPLMLECDGEPDFCYALDAALLSGRCNHLRSTEDRAFALAHESEQISRVRLPLTQRLIQDTHRILDDKHFDLDCSKRTGVGERTVCLAQADDWLNTHETDESAFKTRSWLRQPPTEKQLQYLPPECRHDFGLTRYRASALMTFGFNKQAIRQLIDAAARLERRAA